MYVCTCKLDMQAIHGCVPGLNVCSVTNNYCAIDFSDTGPNICGAALWHQPNCIPPALSLFLSLATFLSALLITGAASGGISS